MQASVSLILEVTPDHLKSLLKVVTCKLDSMKTSLQITDNRLAVKLIIVY